jgi:hypothetical protein
MLKTNRIKEQDSHLFLVHNFFSVISAEQIIKQNKITKAFALIVTKQSMDYINKCIDNMDKSLWKKIEIDQILFNVKFNPLVYREKVKRHFSEKEKRMEEIFRKHHIQKLYFSDLRNINQKIIYVVAQKKGMQIDFYEEGIALYYNPSINTKFNYIKHKTKEFFLGEEYKKLLKNKINFEADNLYCFLPEKYEFANARNKIKLNFSLNHKNEDKIKKLNIETLFLSRPVSEDNKMPLNCELNILDKFLSGKNFKNIYFKFHPREKQDKIELLKRRFAIKTLPGEYQNIPAEEIVWFSNIKNLVGYDTSTLAYMSELKNNIKVYSLLEEIVKYNHSFSLNKVYELYKEKFKNIELIKL